MRYLVLGKTISQGIRGDDSSSLQRYFELGWEVVGSRIDVIRNVSENPDYLNDTTIVSPEDRLFMYSAFSPRVLSAERFFSNFDDYLKEGDFVEDWTEILKFSFLSADKFVDPANGLYRFALRDKKLLRDGFDFNDVRIDNLGDESFVVVSLRARDHASKRNSSKKNAIKFINSLQSRGVSKIFVFGRGADDVAVTTATEYVARLDEFLYLIRQEKCLALIAQSSGPVLLAMMASRAPIFIIDPTGAAHLKGDNAVLGGKCIQISEVRIKKFRSLNRLHRTRIVNAILS